MPEEVNYEPDTGLIRVRVWGNDPIEDWVDSREKVLKIYETRGAYMLIADVREQHSAPSILDIIEFGENWPCEIRLAVLMSENTRDDVMVLETVGRHQSKSMRVFFDEDEAIQWLNQ